MMSSRFIRSCVQNGWKIQKHFVSDSAFLRCNFSCSRSGNIKSISSFMYVRRLCVTSTTFPSTDNEYSPQNNNPPIKLRQMPRTVGERDRFLLKNPDQPMNAKSLKVSVIGAPNAGKSTLTNMLLGWRISSTSSKVHTTRSKLNVVLTKDEKQIVFLDTPGMVHPQKKKTHHLEKSLLTDPHSSFKEADLIAVVVDVSVPWGRNELDKEVLKALLLHQEKQSILVLNKIDELKSADSLFPIVRNLTNGRVGGKSDSKVVYQEVQEPKSPSNVLNKIMKKESSASDLEREQLELDLSTLKQFHHYYSQLRRLSKIVENQKGFSYFDRVFMVSAKEGDGIRDLRDYFLSQAKDGDWLYHSSTVTDQDPLTIAKECVWEKLMDHLPQEVPYNVEVELVRFEEDEYGVIRIAMDLHCHSKRHLKLLLGSKGQKIKLIADEAKQELMNAFRHDLTLMLIAKLSKGEKK